MVNSLGLKKQLSSPEVVVVVKELVKKHDETYVDEKIKLLDTEIMDGEKIKNVIRWLKKACAENWTDLSASKSNCERQQEPELSFEERKRLADERIEQKINWG